MRDGVQIAVDVWLPRDYQAGQRLPVLMRTTRYGRDGQFGWAFRLMLALKLTDPHGPGDDQTDYLNERHFVVVVADARGSGASGGHRNIEFSREEVSDLGELASWAAKQSWSNERVGAFGTSYEGATAELTAATKTPALRAVAAFSSQFDTGMQVFPGGIYNQGMIQSWSEQIRNLDQRGSDVCVSAGLAGLRCWWAGRMVRGVKRVDDDRDGRQLAAILAERHNQYPDEQLSRIEFRDDPIPLPGGSTATFAEISSFGHRTEIEESRVAMQIWCGWLDSTVCEGALARYSIFKNPQQLIMGPFPHNLNFNADPFRTTSQHLPPTPTLEEQNRMMADFFDRLLRPEIPEPIESGIRYYTMGEGQWHEVRVWPPPEFDRLTRFYLAAAHVLSTTPPSDVSATDSYVVNFSATTGTRSRWTGELTEDAFSQDRSAEDNKLQVYTSAPLETDVEITGSPVAVLEVSSIAPDGAFFAYLEDVAPDGRVTLLDEGELRAVCRGQVDPRKLLFTPIKPVSSSSRNESQPLIPGEPTELNFSMWPTSIMLRKGHRLRIAFAGADASSFRRYPAAGDVTWTIYRQTKRASYLEVPLRSR